MTNPRDELQRLVDVVASASSIDGERLPILIQLRMLQQLLGRRPVEPRAVPTQEWLDNSQGLTGLEYDENGERLPVKSTEEVILREGKCAKCERAWVVKGNPTAVVSVLAVHCICGHVTQ